MPLYDVPIALRIGWSIFPDLAEAHLQRLRRHPLPGFFGSPEVQPLLASWGIHTLGDLARLLPEEVLSLPGATPDALHEIAVCVAYIVTETTIGETFTSDDLQSLDRIDIGDAEFTQGTLVILSAAGIRTLGDIARTSHVTLDTLGLSVNEQRDCILAFLEHLPTPSAVTPDGAYEERPLPEGFEARPFAQDDLGRSWLGSRLIAEGLTTYGDVLRFLADPRTLNSRVYSVPVRSGIQHFVALQAGTSYPGLASDARPARVPFRDEGYVAQRLIPRGLSAMEDGHLTGVRLARQGRFPWWAKDLYRHGIDTLSLLARADLAFLWDAAKGDATRVCEMIVAVRRALMEYHTAGSSLAVYGPADLGLTAAIPHRMPIVDRSRPHARPASSDVDTPPLLWATRMAAEAIRHARSTEDEVLIDFDRMDAREQTALFQEAEAAIHATFDTIAGWDDAKIARFVRAHRR